MMRKQPLKITFLTLFPESFDSFLAYPVIRKAADNALVDITVADIKEYTDGCFRAIDDSPYGGGSGLLLRTDTMCNALKVTAGPSSRTILLGPKGGQFSQAKAHELTKEDHIVLIAGHYEGVDERFREYIDEEISIGDYILTGGETAAMVVAEAVIRLLDGAIKDSSAGDESFENDILEYPQYTHPALFEGRKVPEVLLSGNKAEISFFNETEAVKDTIRLRPDLLPSNRDFTHCSFHKNFRNEETIIRWAENMLPLPEILYSDKNYLLLSKLKGRQLKYAGRNKILKTCVSVLKMLWSMDVSSCPCNENTANTIEHLKQCALPYEAWCRLHDLEDRIINEDQVFSHGNLSLDNILVNGNGVTGLINLQSAGIADRYRDLAAIISSLEIAGIGKEELADLLEITVDEEKLSYFIVLNELQQYT